MKLNKWEKAILIILLISIMAVAAMHFRPAGKRAIVARSGEVIMEIDLSKIKTSKEWVIEREGHRNIIRAEPGRIRFKESNCPKGICVKSGWLKRRGDQSVCLPHKLSITIEGGDVDAFTR